MGCVRSETGIEIGSTRGGADLRGVTEYLVARYGDVIGGGRPGKINLTRGYRRSRETSRYGGRLDIWSPWTEDVKFIDGYVVARIVNARQIIFGAHHEHRVSAPGRRGRCIGVWSRCKVIVQIKADVGSVPGDPHKKNHAISEKRIFLTGRYHVIESTCRTVVEG